MRPVCPSKGRRRSGRRARDGSTPTLGSKSSAGCSRLAPRCRSRSTCSRRCSIRSACKARSWSARRPPACTAPLDDLRRLRGRTASPHAHRPGDPGRGHERPVPGPGGRDPGPRPLRPQRLGPRLRAQRTASSRISPARSRHPARSATGAAAARSSGSTRSETWLWRPSPTWTSATGRKRRGRRSATLWLPSPVSDTVRCLTPGYARGGGSTLSCARMPRALWSAIEHQRL